MQLVKQPEDPSDDGVFKEHVDVFSQQRQRTSVSCALNLKASTVSSFWRDHQHFKLRRFGWIHHKIKITNAKRKVIWGYNTHFDITSKPPVPQPQTLWQWTSLIYQESCAAHRLRGQERSADGQVPQTKGNGWKMMIGSTKTSESRYIPRNIH